MGGTPAAAATAFAFARLLLVLATAVGRSSLDDDSTRRGGCGRAKTADVGVVVVLVETGDVDEADAAFCAAASPAVEVLMLLSAPGRGEKLPGARFACLDCCIALVHLLRVRYILAWRIG